MNWSGKIKLFNLKPCYGCGSTKGDMYYNHDNDNNKLCRKCWRRYYYNRLLAAEFRLTRLHTHGRQFYFKYEKLRTGICQDCKKNKLTGLHHEKFDESNPLANTRELCQSCHDKEGWRLGQLRRRIKVIQ